MRVRAAGLASTGAPIMNPPPEQHPVSHLARAHMPRLLIETHAAGPTQDGYEVELKAWFKILSDSRD